MNQQYDDTFVISTDGWGFGKKKKRKKSWQQDSGSASAQESSPAQWSCSPVTADSWDTAPKEPYAEWSAIPSEWNHDSGTQKSSYPRGQFDDYEPYIMPNSVYDEAYSMDAQDGKFDFESRIRKLIRGMVATILVIIGVGIAILFILI